MISTAPLEVTNPSMQECVLSMGTSIFSEQMSSVSYQMRFLEALIGGERWIKTELETKEVNTSLKVFGVVITRIEWNVIDIWVLADSNCEVYM